MPVDRRRWIACALLALCADARAADVLHVFNWNNSLSPRTIERFEAQARSR